MESKQHLLTLSRAGTPPAGYANVGTYPATGATNWWGTSGKYKQPADIDVQADTAVRCIGNTTTKFAGIYNGQGFTISNVTFSTTYIPVTRAALFAYTTTGCVLQDMRLGGTWAAAGFERAAILVASATGTTIKRIVIDVTANFSTTVIASTLAGSLVASSIENCVVTGSISLTARNYAGGLAGSCSASTINQVRVAFVGNIHATNTTGAVCAGGIVASADNSSMANMINAITGNITAYENCGGIVGCHTYSVRTGSMSGCICAMKGDLTASSNCGGLVGTFTGYQTFKPTLTNCLNYMCGTINGYPTGGLLGTAAIATVSKCYMAMNGNISGSSRSTTIPALDASVTTSNLFATSAFGGRLGGATFTNDAMTSATTPFAYHTGFTNLPYLNMAYTDSDGNTTYLNTPYPNISGNASIGGSYNYFTITNQNCTDPVKVTSSTSGTFLYKFNTSTNEFLAPTESNVTSIGTPYTLLNTTPVITPTKTDVSTYGGTNGAITLSVSGGSGTPTYLWNDNITTKDRSSLAAGTYTVTVTLSGGSIQETIVIAQPIHALYTKTNALGTLLSGSITLDVAGGTGTYAYSWNDGVTTKNRVNIGAGTYIVTVTSGTYTSVQSIPITYTEYTLTVNAGVGTLAISALPTSTLIHVSINGLPESYHSFGSVSIKVASGSTYAIRCNNAPSATQSGTIPGATAINTTAIINTVKNSLGAVRFEFLESNVKAAIRENFSAVFGTNTLIDVASSNCGISAKTVEKGSTYTMQQSSKMDALMIDAGTTPTVVTTPSGTAMSITQTTASTITIGDVTLSVGESTVVGDYRITLTE